MVSTPLLVQGDARALPLPDASVDLIVTSPPYFGQRDYRDAGESLARQIGAEGTPREYIASLLAVTRECMRVLKPAGSLFVNLADKFSGGNSGQSGLAALGKKYSGGGHSDRKAKIPSSGVLGMPPKSQLLLPERYRIGCVDELGLIARAVIVWKKSNGMPESVTDRVRCSHEYVFHFTKQPHYYSAMDEIREPGGDYARLPSSRATPNGQRPRMMADTCNPLGRAPGSVWEIASQPLNVPDHVAHKRCCGGRKRAGCEDGLDHYAAFPFALVRPIILGWSPREVCIACGEGRRPRVSHVRTLDGEPIDTDKAGYGTGPTSFWNEGRTTNKGVGNWRFGSERGITGYACACPDVTAPATPGIVLDPFGGTGSTGLVAAMHGRTGVTLDASWDYCDLLARWRVNDPHERARAAGLEPEKVSVIPRLAPGQGSLFDGTG